MFEIQRGTLYPVLPLRDIVAFPHMIVPLFVGREKSVRALEEVANSYKGVKESYALQAGREIRIFVKPEDVDDLASTRLARDISKQIEETMQYPGQIKVTVIRETRAVDYAK